MEGLPWLAKNWFDILSAIGIVGGLFFTATALYSDAKTRKIANLLTITTNHREIWKEFYSRPELARVLNPAADVVIKSVTPAEEEFVKFVILHLSSSYYAMKDELLMKMEGMRKDVGSFFSLPVPQATWDRIKKFQNEDFVMFVDDCRRGGHSSSDCQSKPPLQIILGLTAFAPTPKRRGKRSPSFPKLTVFNWRPD